MRKQETRKRRARKNRSQKRSHTRSHRSHNRIHNRIHNRSHRRQRKQGGSYLQVTDEEVNGIPVSAGAVISVPGYPSMGIDEFKRHAEYRDFQGEEQ